MKCKVITNNAKLLEADALKTFDIDEVIYMDTLDIIEVMKTVRNYIHKGHKLLTHPLSGSVKPVETPFKSVAISVDPATLDMQSLSIIGDAILMAEKFKRNENRALTIPESILDDFRLIDYDLIRSGLEGINNF
ncbi:MAG: GrdX family protein [Clostridia bacterium]|nr:GrdX family protein [Clostridia bacterium]